MIEDVVTNVRDAFLDEGVDEQVLQELKQIWTNKLLASKAVEVTPEPTAPLSQPSILANNPKVSEALSSRVLCQTTTTICTLNVNAVRRFHVFLLFPSITR